MSQLVVGSVAYDTVRTPAGARTDALGGSATFFSIAASCFAPVSLVAVVGEDFRQEHVELLNRHQVDTSGLQRSPGKTFRWSGDYGEDVNSRETLDTQLNVFSDFSPKLDSAHRKQPFLFLANIDPELQMSVLGQMEERPKLVALDTMNFWIEGKNRELRRAVKEVDLLFVDEGEAKALAEEGNLVKCAKRILAMGPGTVVIKRGEHGVVVFGQEFTFAAPGFPLESVTDPTGAGDSFAGGFLGYIAATGNVTDQSLRRAAVLGSVMGSFAVESFSADRLSSVNRRDVERRFRLFSELSQFALEQDGEVVPWRGSPVTEPG